MNIHDLPRLMANPASPSSVALVQQLRARVVFFAGRQQTVVDWRSGIEQTICHNSTANSSGGQSLILWRDDGAVPCIPMSFFEGSLQMRLGMLDSTSTRPLIQTPARVNYTPISEAKLVDLGRKSEWLWRLLLISVYAVLLLSFTPLMPEMLRFLVGVACIFAIPILHVTKSKARVCRIMLAENQWAEHLLDADESKADLVSVPNRMLHQWISQYAGSDADKTEAALAAWHNAWSDPKDFIILRAVARMYSELADGDLSPVHMDSHRELIPLGLSRVIAHTAERQTRARTAAPGLSKWPGIGQAHDPANESELR